MRSVDVALMDSFAPIPIASSFAPTIKVLLKTLLHLSFFLFWRILGNYEGMVFVIMMSTGNPLKDLFLDLGY